MFVTVDMPHENLDSFRAMLSDYGIEVRHFENDGPAGGNPRFHLTVDSHHAMQALSQFYWG